MPDIGRYRIQVVSELTGIPAPTLRAWERRYGIPTPARTASAYRLYSDYDVAMVRRLRDLCANGMSIAEAAKMVRASEEGAARLVGADGDPYEVAVNRFVDAIQAFDTRAVEREAARAQYLGPATSVFDRVFAPVMRRVGELWHAGELSIAQEHIATRVVGDMVRGMMRLTNPEATGYTVILACLADEDHDLPVYGVALRLASWGIGHITLGVRTPPAAVADTLRHTSATAVGLSMTMPLEPARAAELFAAYRDACGATPWFVGGAGVASVADLVRELGGMVIEGDFSDSRPHIERLLRDARRPTGDFARAEAEPADDVAVQDAV